MVISIFGESCVGKSTVADALAKKTSGRVFSGKDYLRLAKDETGARNAFRALLAENIDSDACIIYVASEKEQMALIPEGAVRVLMTADINVIKERFARRMHGTLPPPVAAMLERKHGCFDSEPADIRVCDGENTIDGVVEDILKIRA